MRDSALAVSQMEEEPAMQLKTVMNLAIVAGLTSALTACGYHRIGAVSAPAKEASASRPMPVRVAPKKDEPSLSASAYFPLKAGAVYTYSRSYAEQGAAGTRVMTVASAEGAEAWVNNRLELDGRSMSLQFSGRVATTASRLTATLPSYANVHTLLSFSLKSPLAVGAAWDAEIDGRAWSFTAKRIERVTVPAGTYDALVVEALTSTSSLAGIQHVKQTLSFAPNVGLVKVVLTVDEQRETAIVNQTITEELLSVQ
jgi:hypothetical protein